MVSYSATLPKFNSVRGYALQWIYGDIKMSLCFVISILYSKNAVSMVSKTW